ncbi:hypothetical protein [Kingella potus]|uniref:hypothetical protein n=1 Tax=Kingella potus TaxID=265175 RepID=UPI001FD1BEF7|nr:hypothetical protein [Kingella potus]UOO99940.1 hypothetical protein LVJ84_07700 [Kingella potus]
MRRGATHPTPVAGTDFQRGEACAASGRVCRPGGARVFYFAVDLSCRIDYKQKAV